MISLSSPRKQLGSWGVDLRHVDREDVGDPAVLELLNSTEL